MVVHGQNLQLLVLKQRKLIGEVKQLKLGRLHTNDIIEVHM